MVLICVVLFSPSVGAEEPQNAAPVPPPPNEQAAPANVPALPQADAESQIVAVESPVPSLAAASEDPLLKDARLFSEAGELVAARDKYRSFLTQDGIPKSLKKKAQAELEAVNMKILFSPIETEDSLVYEVKSGDNLYNIAKKYHTTVALIQKSNHLKSDLIRPGMKLKVAKAVYSLAIDKSENTLELFSDDMLLKTYSIGTGENNSTPVGEFTIDTKLENPTWYKAGAVVPPDSPDNILGTRWLGFSLQGYGIHGTTMPETIGKQASSGCIRMLNEEAEELYAIVPVGTKVTVRD